MSKICDHTSVGVVIRGKYGNIALLKRAKFPVGVAPVAGHIDDHGSIEQAALDEASEELGLDLPVITKTSIYERRIDNKCRREGGDYHVWSVFEAVATDTELHPSDDETKGADWYTPEQIQQLADRTKAFQAGKISTDEWEENPGLEEVWVPFLSELGYITV